MTDLVVVGGGVLGTFHAYHALRQGLKVVLLEQDAAPQGATVRNFGQVVPSGMPAGKWQQFGVESTRIYKELQAAFDISVRQHGSVYLASDAQELGLLEELNVINQNSGYPSILLTKDACLARYPGLRADYCVGGLFFPEEVTVEPRVMIHRVLEYLQEQFDLTYLPRRQVIACEPGADGVMVRDSSGHLHCASKVVICNGKDFKKLYPETFAASDIEVCKLQMMQTGPQPGVSLKGSILTGLTIRRYESFRACPSYGALDSSDLDPRAKAYGVHILLKQAVDGSIILGDSHEYRDAAHADELGEDVREDINAFIVEQAKMSFDLPDWNIQCSWLGFYAQCRTRDMFLEEVDRNVHVVTAIGGKGMTGSAGFAKRHVATLFNVVV